ncbi:Lipase member M, partial [Frankliniella fusca]
VEDLLNPIGEVVNPVVEQLKPVVEVVAGLAPIPGKLLGTISPHTSKLNGLLQSGLLQNSLSQFTSDIVTSLTSVVAEIANALLPVPKYLRPDKEAPKFGFVGEAYNVTTSDGYILGVFRVRNGTCGSYRAVVAIPPGILSNAASFIYIKENSLVYRLARRCFDVWLLTFRGYLFGRGHTHLSDTSSKFWDFYAYHWGAIDLPAQLEFVSNKTGSTGIRYVGSDQAATAMFFMNHVHGERYQKMMDSTFIMAPIGYLAHLRSLVFDMLAVGRDALTVKYRHMFGVRSLRQMLVLLTKVESAFR